MASEREESLRETWDSLRKKEFISLEDIEELGLIISKVYDRLKELEESRNSWRNKYEKLKVKNENRKS